jgi:YVTN family beta-propeller protein
VLSAQQVARIPQEIARTLRFPSAFLIYNEADPIVDTDAAALSGVPAFAYAHNSGSGNLITEHGLVLGDAPPGRALADAMYFAPEFRYRMSGFVRDAATHDPVVGIAIGAHPAAVPPGVTEIGGFSGPDGFWSTMAPANSYRLGFFPQSPALPYIGQWWSGRSRFEDADVVTLPDGYEVDRSFFSADLVRMQVPTSRAYVATTDDQVAVIDPQTQQVVKRIALEPGGHPFGVATAPGTHRVYVSQTTLRRIAVIATDSDTVVGSLTLEDAPFTLARNPRSATLYAVSGDHVDLVDTATGAVTSTGFLGAELFGIAVTPDGAHVLVTQQRGTNDVIVLDAATGAVDARIPIGSAARSVAIDRGGARAYVAALSGAVAVIDLVSLTLLTTIALPPPLGPPFGAGPQVVAVSPDGATLYVTCEDNTVRAIDVLSGTVHTVTQFPDQPYGASVTTDGATLYVTRLASGTAAAVSTSTEAVVATIAVGAAPFSVGVFVTSQ